MSKAGKTRSSSDMNQTAFDASLKQTKLRLPLKLRIERQAVQGLNVLHRLLDGSET